jgi:2-desacetyl-2-hydroxyethyl bacteriochlorophyllide A dehydrogenase
MEEMRAARYLEQGRIVCEQAPVPALSDGEVLVRTQLAAICGSDLHVVYDGMSFLPQPCPHGYPGHEGLGEVIESRSPLLRPGAKVLTCPAGPYSRCFADYQVLPAVQCHALPAYKGSMEHLLMAQQFGTTIFALRQMPADVVGKTVMVMGQGSAGNFLAYNLKRAGAAKVIVSDKTEARLTASRVFGADVTLKAEPEAVKQAVMEHTGGQGVDYLVDAVGHADAFLQAVDLVRENGRMLWFGLPDTMNPIPFNFYDFFRRKLRTYSTYGAQLEPDGASFRLALDLIATGQIDVTTMVTHRFPIEQIDKAMRIAMDRSDNAGKVVVTF